jgi:hypothetical protein
MPVSFRLSNGPQNDRQKYVTPSGDPTTFGFEPAAGALISSSYCILESCYISIRETLVGTIFIQFYDSNVIVGANNVSSYDTCSEPLTVAGGTFVWEPTSALAVQYQYPETRRSVRTCREASDRAVQEIAGVPFDNGLFIVASTSKTGLVLAAANLIRIAAFVRSPAEAGGGQ